MICGRAAFSASPDDLFTLPHVEGRHLRFGSRLLLLGRWQLGVTLLVMTAFWPPHLWPGLASEVLSAYGWFVSFLHYTLDLKSVVRYFFSLLSKDCAVTWAYSQASTWFDPIPPRVYVYGRHTTSYPHTLVSFLGTFRLPREMHYMICSSSVPLYMKVQPR